MILFKVGVGIHDVSVRDRPVGGHVGRDDLREPCSSLREKASSRG